MLVDINVIIRVSIKKSRYQISISNVITITTQGAHTSLLGILSFILFLSK